MKITAENGLKIEKMGSTSQKPRFLGYFCGFRGLQTLNLGKNESVEQAGPAYPPQGVGSADP